jgi:hypothetical protein
VGDTQARDEIYEICARYERYERYEISGEG